MLIIIFVVRLVKMTFGEHICNAIRQIAPRHEPLETPVEVREETQVTRWDGHEYKTKVIDKLSNVG